MLPQKGVRKLNLQDLQDKYFSILFREGIEFKTAREYSFNVFYDPVKCYVLFFKNQE